MNQIKQAILISYMVLLAVGMPEIKALEELITPMSKEIASSDGGGNSSRICGKVD
jgi:hypothetical protein